MTTEIDYEKMIIEALNEYIRVIKKKDYTATIDSRLIDDLDIDSLDTIELAFAAEDKFGIKIPIDQMMGFQFLTVRDFVSFLKNPPNDSKN